MNIRCDDYDHVTVISITGELTSEATEGFRRQIEERRRRLRATIDASQGDRGR